MTQEYNELIENHAVMAEVNCKMREEIARDPLSFKREDYGLAQIEYGPVRFQTLPTFINRSFTSRAEQASRRVTDLVKSLPRRIFDLNPVKISSFYQIAQDTAEYLLRGYRDDHVQAMLARGDFFITRQGFKCLEINLGAKIGGWEQQLWRLAYLNNPNFKKYLYERGASLEAFDNLSLMIKHIINHSMRFRGSDADSLNCAVVMPESDMGKDENLQNNMINQLYQAVLRSVAPSLSGELFLCEDTRLKLKGDDLYFGDKQVSSVVELNHGMIPVELYNAYVVGRVVMFNGPLTWIMSNKLNLALLSDPRFSDFFSTEERQDIQTYIPWTRKAESGSTDYHGQTIELREFVLSNKDLFILKPADGVAGFGISVGRAKTQNEWQQAVNTAFTEKKWVVQEYVAGLEFLYKSRINSGMRPHKMVWGFFQFGSAYAGGLLRVMESGGGREVINSHQGAELSIVFEVDEKET